MTFFKKKRKANQLYVVKTEIISNYNDGTGLGPQYVTQYFLAQKIDACYYELFSKEKLELDRDTYYNSCHSHYFNKPYIVEAKPISEYSDSKEFTDSELFYFITRMNTLNALGAFDEEDDEEDDEMPDEKFAEEMSEEE